METDYPQASLGEVARVRSGYAFKSQDWTDSGVPVVKIANVKDGVLVMDGCSFVAQQVAEEAVEWRLRKGDILLAMTGYIGDVARVRDDRPRILNQRVGRFEIISREELNDDYLFYVLRAPEIKKEIAGLGYGSAQPNVSPKLIHSIQIPLPCLDEQRAIADVLSALDDKIEQNRRTARTLEQLARAIFHAWFVDFEPVKAKAAGATSFPSMPQEIFDTLPTTFTDSDLGPIPDGWDVKPATDVATVAIGKTPPRKEPQWFTTDSSQMPWVSIRDMGTCGAFVRETSEYLTHEAVERFNIRRIPDRSVLLSFKLTLGRVTVADGEITSNEAIAHFVPNSQETIGTEYLYCYLIGFDHNRLGSTSSIATATNSKAIKAMPVLVPGQEFTRAFTELARPMFDSLRSLARESSHLAQLRDYLIPHLLTGQVRVEVANG